MKTFIWDLDGTLVDSYPIILKNLMLTFSKYGEYDQNEVYEFLMKESSKEFFEREEKRLGISVKQLKEENHKIDTVSASEYALIEGAKEVIFRLNELGNQNIIYTHRNSFTVEIMEAHGMVEAFKDIITSDHGFMRKPDPDAINYLVENYNLNKEETYYVGDRNIDIVSGNRAGVKTIYFNQNGVKDSVADYNVTRLLDIINI